MDNDETPTIDRTPVLLDDMADKFLAAAEKFAAHGHFDCRQLALDCAAIAKRLAREAQSIKD